MAGSLNKKSIQALFFSTSVKQFIMKRDGARISLWQNGIDDFSNKEYRDPNQIFDVVLAAFYATHARFNHQRIFFLHGSHMAML